MTIWFTADLHLGHRSSRRRRRHLTSADERCLVGNVVAEVDQAPASLLVRKIADLSGIQSVGIREDLVDRAELVIGEHGEVSLTSRNEPVLPIPQKLFLTKLGLALRDQLISNRTESPRRRTVLELLVGGARDWNASASHVGEVGEEQNLVELRGTA